MAEKVRCAVCGNEGNPQYMKWCPNCQLWACSKHGSYCPKCKKKMK